MPQPQRTRRRVLQAAFDLSGERMSLEIVLGDIAERAGVSVQTILRHFGSRAALFDAVADFARAQVIAERAAPAGDRFLAQEFWDEHARQVTERGRRVHRDRVRTVFAPHLDARPAADRGGADRPAGRGHRRLHLEAAATR